MLFLERTNSLEFIIFRHDGKMFNVDIFLSMKLGICTLKNILIRPGWQKLEDILV